MMGMGRGFFWGMPAYFGAGSSIFFWLFWIFKLALIAGIIVGIFFLIKYLLRKNSNNFFDSEPLEIIKTRYAKGEISKDEYEKLKNDLLKS